METTCNLVELFSGIGSQAKALKNLDVNVNILGTCEWDVHAIAAYDVIHNPSEIPSDILAMDKTQLLTLLEKYTFSNSGKTPLAFKSLCTYSVDALRRIYTSVVRNKNFVDITRLNGEELPDGIDIMTYSFPCQDLSNVGAFHGYNKGIDRNSGSRSSLLWQVGRILAEMKNARKSLPKFLLLENVPTLLSPRHFSNFETWITDLEELGYISKYYQLNACDFGLPQNRPRLLMISVYVGDNVDKWRLVNNYFLEKSSAKDVITDYRATKRFCQYSVQQLLRTNYSSKNIMAEAIECTPKDTVSRRKIWDDNPQIVLPDGSLNPSIDVVRTITTKQDRNPNSGNLYFDSGIEGRSKFRYLTPRECLLFMGFTDTDFKKLRSTNVEFHKGDTLFARDKVIRMAGNSIPVRLLEGIFYQILQIDKLLKSNKRTTEWILKSEDSVEDYSNIIRTFVFKNGIRSRIGNGLYPSNATVVYPKYRTAIYVVKCHNHMFGCEDSGCFLCDHRYWARRMEEWNEVNSVQYAEALDLGWNAVVVNECKLREPFRDKTLAWIVQCIRRGWLDNDQCRVIRQR